METKIYRIRGKRYDSCDPVRGEEGGIEFENPYLVVASSEEEAKTKFRQYNMHSRHGWAIDLGFVKELTKGKDLPLETRLQILSEVIPIIK